MCTMSDDKTKYSPLLWVRTYEPGKWPALGALISAAAAAAVGESTGPASLAGLDGVWHLQQLTSLLFR